MDFYAPRARTHNEEDYRELLEQVQSLQNKLATKTEALLRLGKDLEECTAGRAAHEAKAATYERNLARVEGELAKLSTGEGSIRNTTQRELDEAKREMDRLQVENATLKHYNLDLKAEIRDLQKDCKTFRQQLAKLEVARLETVEFRVEVPAPRRNARTSSDATCDGDAETVGKYEKLMAENKQMEVDLKTLLNSKEELVLERDALAKKVERLSGELTYLLNGDPRRVVEDLDALMAENRYLKAQLDNAQEESQTIKATLEKYRSVAEQVHARRQMESTSGQPNETSADDQTKVAVVNMKQIRELLSSNSIELTDGDYRALSNVLLDLCNDKQMALAHQRRANKILGNRLHEVEQRLQTLESKSPRSLSPRPI